MREYFISFLLLLSLFGDFFLVLANNSDQMNNENLCVYFQDEEEYKKCLIENSDSTSVLNLEWLDVYE